VPAREGEALYLRPLEFALDPFLGVRPSREYQFLLFASPAGAYFPGGVRPVTVWLSTEYVRAAKGGTGEAKCAGNYAASLVAQAQAAEQGCDQVVWLDAVEHRYVEEMGGMNLYFVFADGRLVTPALTGTLLPGVTRDSILALGADMGLDVEERLISTEEWEAGCADGAISEVFACGTAAVVTPVGSVKHARGSFDVADGEPGAVTMKVREALLGIQHGTAPDPHGWMHTIA
jgi:branched-chain amino acid aminotransferase